MKTIKELQSEKNSLIIKKQILVNTMDLFIPKKDQKNIYAKIQEINRQIKNCNFGIIVKYFRTVKNRDIVYMYRNSLFDNNQEIKNISQNLGVNFEAFKKELRSEYIDISDMHQ